MIPVLILSVLTSLTDGGDPSPRCALDLDDGPMTSALIEALELELATIGELPACTVRVRWPLDLEAPALVTVERDAAHASWTLDRRRVPDHLQSRLVALTARHLITNLTIAAPLAPSPTPAVRGPSAGTRLEVRPSVGFRSFLGGTFTTSFGLEWARRWVRITIATYRATQPTHDAALEALVITLQLSVSPFQRVDGNSRVLAGAFIEGGLASAWASSPPAGFEGRVEHATVKGLGGRLEGGFGRFFGVLEVGVLVGLRVIAFDRPALQLHGPFVGVRLGVEL